MTLWIALAALMLIAVAIVVRPLYSAAGRLSVPLAAVIVVVVGLSAGLYYSIGNPGVTSGASTAPDVDEMVASLAARLEKDPDDIGGWTMLGRSYQTLERYDDSIAAYEKAIALESNENAQTLVELALVLLEAQKGGTSERASQLLENAISIDPINPNALFYSGFAAANRGETDLAADRWERLMGLDAPPEIRSLLQERINEWRGIEGPAESAPIESTRDVVAVNLSLSQRARAALPDDASVYVIARDPEQPSPPIAVARRRLSELPLVVTLSDRDSMVPGRTLSAFSRFEIVARVSISGQPMAQSGDWFASIIFESVAEAQATVDLIIEQQVP